MPRIPQHLARYVVKQDYALYTPEEQAVWRFILRQLKHTLKTHGHECYLKGLETTGLHEDAIPNLREMNKKLAPLGWSTVAVSGFIPPSAFMELQSLGFLPIAVEIRRRENILYTPAPDIVHEAAGHAPILVQPEFSHYLKQYAHVARSAIVSYEDLALYDAIRELSDIKEDPNSSPEKIKKHELKLQQAQKKITQLSEAQLLGRMNWWTVEYGLIGTLKKPKIFGAGLLSSILEAQTCLQPKVKKLPLTLDCIKYNYNITEPQPQLFVASSFQHLEQVLNQMADGMAFRRGGVYGVKKAIEARSVNTVVLDSGAQISGRWVRCLHEDDQIVFIKTKGPTQLAFQDKQISAHGIEAHREGYSLALGRFILFYSRGGGGAETRVAADQAQTTFSTLRRGSLVRLEYESGLIVKGRVHKRLRNPVQVCTLSECHIQYKGEVLFEPSWGVFDLLLGTEVKSVFGGAADRAAFEGKVFAAHRVPTKDESCEGLQDLYEHIYKLRVSLLDEQVPAYRLSQKVPDLGLHDLARAAHLWLDDFQTHWLAGLELYEMLNVPGLRDTTEELDVGGQLYGLLDDDDASLSDDEKRCLKMGLKLIEDEHSLMSYKGVN